MTICYIDLMQCPGCACRFKLWAVMSRNTFGAKFYTDGYVDGSMYGESRELLECPGCQAYLWRRELRVLESRRSHLVDQDDAWEAAPWGTGVRGRGFEALLHRAPWHGASQEKFIRVRAWWSFNRGYRGEIDGYWEPGELRRRIDEIFKEIDPAEEDDSLERFIRNALADNEAARQEFAKTYLTLDMSPPRDLPPDQTANLERLVELLDPANEHESVLRAEVLRELGRFEECLQALDGTAPDVREEPTAVRIRQLAREGIRRVELLE